MGTTAEKINYAINATNDIAEGINNIGGNITQNTELADFRDELDRLYNEMPKVTGEGTNIILQDTRRGKIKITPKGNIEQATTKGYNLLNLENFTTVSTVAGVTISPNGDGGIKMKGTSDSTGNLDITFALVMEGAYTLSTKVVGSMSSSPQFLLRNAQNANVMYNNAMRSDSTTSQTYTNLNQTITYIRIYFVSDITFDCVLYPQLVTGETVKDWEKYTGNMPSPNPSYTQIVKSVTGNNSVSILSQKQLNLSNIKLYKISDYQDYIFKTTGKNLLDITKIERGKAYTYGNIGQVPTEGNYTSRATLSPKNAIPVKPLTTYTMTIPSGFRVAVAELTEEKVSLGDSGWQSVVSYTITTQSNTHYIGFNFSKSDNSDFSNTDWQKFLNNNWQLEIGDTATIQEPYGRGKWYIHKEISDATITAFASKSGSTANNMYTTNVIQNIQKPNSGNVECPIICTHFVKKSVNVIYSQDILGIGINTNGTIGCGFGASSSLTTLELANTWLASNPLDIFFVLDIPDNIEITDINLINQLENLNKVIGTGGTILIETESNSNNAQLIVNASALASFENS